MADEHDRDHGGGDQSLRKKSYRPPRLVHYGSVNALTAAGSGTTLENVMGMGCSMSVVMRVNPACT